jgi:hypothetical protein
MALILGVLETCVRALETCEPSCIGSPARFFFMLEVRSPQGAAGDAVALPETSQQGGSIRNRRTRNV